MRSIRVVVVLLSLAVAMMAQDSSLKELPRYKQHSSAKPAAVPFHFYGAENRSTVGDDPRKDVCLDLHTMVVARDDKQTDATHLVSQRTCTPARQFQTKAAVVNPR
jgi:hypothetical protein